jgi:hypothetical protein
MRHRAPFIAGAMVALVAIVLAVGFFAVHPNIHRAHAEQGGIIYGNE